MKSPCPRFEPELSAYLDGETAPALRAEIEAHLPSCDGCRAAVSRLRGVSRVLRRWDAHETRYAASSGFRNRVFAEVGVTGDEPRSSAAWRVAAAVGFVAVGAAGFSLVAPRLARTNEDPRYEQIASEVTSLKQALAARESPGRASPQSVDEPPVERLGPFAPVVDQPSGDDETSPRTSNIPDDYEQRGDRRFLREALPEHDDYNRERGALVLQEQMAKALETAKAPPVEHPTSAPPAPTLSTFLGEVRVAQREYAPYRQVQVWPIELFGGNAAAATTRVLACEKAVHDEILRVVEGPVRETVVAENRDPKRAVLVLAGDVLFGGRQDRVARADVLVGPGEQISIPTYTCGRERRTSYVRFSRSGGVAPPGLRALVAADRALLSGGLGQDRFDMSVAETVKALASPGPSGSLDKIFTNDTLAADTKKYVDFFEKRLDAPGVVGLAVSAGSRLLGVEVFGDHATFAEHRARIVRSYVLAALAASPDGTRLEGAPPSRDSVVAVLAAAPTSAFHDEPPTGSGTLSVFRGVAGAVFGYGVLDGAHAVHAVMFTSVPDYPEPTGGHGRPAGEGGGAETGASGEGGHGGTRESGPPPDVPNAK